MESFLLTHWGQVTHICVSKLTIIGSDNGLSPGRRQAIIWTNAGILLIGPLGIKFSEIFIKILSFSFKKIRLKMSSAKRRPFCLGLNVLSKLWYNSWPNVTKWHWSGSTLVQMMAQCLMPPSDYRTQYWPFMEDFLFHSSERIFARIAHELNL